MSQIDGPVMLGSKPASKTRAEHRCRRQRRQPQSALARDDGVRPASRRSRRNVSDNPQVLVRIVHPEDLSEYDIEGRYLHSETSGELFESVRVQLDAVAAQTGMTGTFRLRSVDILGVDRCSRVGDVPTEARAETGRRSLSSLRLIDDRRWEVQRHHAPSIWGHRAPTA